MAGNAANYYNWNPYGQYYENPSYHTDQQAAYHHSYPTTSYSGHHAGYHAGYPSLHSLSSFIGLDTGLSILAFLAFALWLIHLFLPQLRDGLGLGQGFFRSLHPSQAPPPSILDKTEEEVVREVLGEPRGTS
ncbi:hypothetical protein E2C01_016933 [Portunus trituberculatus]|uniref:Uncharacterized protein n=1 Tax=Portunus trituberculatus TaxID=210409 RepID=A0A5B7DRU1_PORTR|nr:hypothetical protein [Portunus trituberculatus]